MGWLANKILPVLKEYPYASPSFIAHRVDRSPFSVGNQLRKLERAGKVIHVEHGVWALTGEKRRFRGRY